MNRYIRLDDALKAYNEAMDELVKWQMNEWQLGDFSECEFNTTDCKHIARKIADAPSIDIVRCRECKYWLDGSGLCKHWSKLYGSVLTKADDYCSYGERKGE